MTILRAIDQSGRMLCAVLLFIVAANVLVISCATGRVALGLLWTTNRLHDLAAVLERAIRAVTRSRRPPANPGTPRTA